MDLLAPDPAAGLVPPEQCHQVPRLCIGVLLLRLQRNMQAAAAHMGLLQSSPQQAGAPKSSPPPLLHIYSGHDSTIMPLLVSVPCIAGRARGCLCIASMHMQSAPRHQGSVVPQGVHMTRRMHTTSPITGCRELLVRRRRSGLHSHRM